MGYIKGKNRYQVSMLPPVLDDYVAEDSEVRVIDAFADSLTDIQFQYSNYDKQGNQPYNPLDMLKIFIYCYAKRIRSSRRIETECKTNVELMWLINGLTPDDKTICDFRKNNKEQLYKVLKEFTVVCKKAKLFSAELVAIDGTKIEASCGRNKIFTKGSLKHRIEEIDKYVKDYLSKIEKNDELELKRTKYTKEEISEIILNLQKKRDEYKELAEKLEESGESQISITDPDCRLMRKRNGKTTPAYNIQAAVDSENNMIVDFEATNHVNDTQELSNMAIKAKEELEVEKLEVLADAGYENRDEIEKCVENNITPIVNIRATGQTGAEYTKDDFIYNSENDIYICPGGRKLECPPYKKHNRDIRNQRTKVYIDKNKCQGCPYKERCFSNKKGYKKIDRWEKEGIIDNMKTAESKVKLKRRKEIVEPVFGVIKRCLDFEYFLLRGLKGAMAEFSLAALCYDLRRAINILGVKTLIQIIKG